MAFLLQRSRNLWQRSGLLGSCERAASSALLRRHQALATSALEAEVDLSGSKASGRPKKKGAAPKAQANKASNTPSIAASDSTETAGKPASKPKKRASAYSFFQMEKFAELKHNTSEKRTLGEVSKEFAAKWKALSDEEKKPYTDKAVQAAPASKSKTKRWTNYTVFISENFDSVKARNPALAATQVMAAMANEWKSVSDKEKEQYTAKAAERNQAASQA